MATSKNPTGKSALTKLARAARCLPSYGWQRLTRSAPRGTAHLIIALADHFEPSSIPGFLAGHAPREIQEERLERWCREYPRYFSEFKDAEGQTFNHTYFYPAEQYERALVQQLAELCHQGWGEIEIHLHHGLTEPTTAQETVNQLVTFRDTLARDHGCLSYEDGNSNPKYAFVHGNYALANCANGFACGVDNEMQVLAETGCYVDMTYPAGIAHRAQVPVVNSIYECALSLGQRAPHRRARGLRVGRSVTRLPFIVQGPLMIYFDPESPRLLRTDDGALTKANPPSLQRLKLWKNAAITIAGRPDWIFIKLHAHSMDPTDTETVLGPATQHFLKDLVECARERNEVVHFASAREMANIALAACDGREGNPGDYRDYRYKLRPASASNVPPEAATMAVRT
jgi:hypothetical protein